MIAVPFFKKKIKNIKTRIDTQLLSLDKNNEYPLLNFFVPGKNAKLSNSWYLNNKLLKVAAVKHHLKIIKGTSKNKSWSIYSCDQASETHLPKNKNLWIINPQHTYKLTVNAILQGNLVVKAVILEYDEKKLLRTSEEFLKLGLNEITFITSSYTKYIGITLKFHESGSIILDPLHFTSCHTAINISNIPIPIEVEYHSKSSSSQNLYVSKTWVNPKQKNISIDSFNPTNVSLNYHLPDDDYFYLDLHSNKLGISSSNQFPWKINFDKKYHLSIDVESLSDKALMSFNLLQYDHHGVMIHQSCTHLTKGKNEIIFSLNKTSPFYRFVLNFSGEGSVIISKINIKQSAQIPDLDETATFTWPSYQNPFKLHHNKVNIACILNSTSYEFLHYNANLTGLSADNWHSEIIVSNPDILLIESNTTWQNFLKNRLIKEIKDILKFCKTLGVKTVLWLNTYHDDYQDYVSLAKEFDHVFSSDPNLSIKHMELQTISIHELPPAIQPVLHNPFRNSHFGLYDVCLIDDITHITHEEEKNLHNKFNKYSSHLLQSTTLNSDQFSEKSFKNSLFPIIKILNYEQLLTVYRQYKVFINLKSKMNNPIRFSQKALEILACGGTLFSVSLPNLNKILKNMIWIEDELPQIKTKIDESFSHDIHQNKRLHSIYREIHTEHTYKNRLNTMLKCIGLSKKREGLPLVSIICSTNKPENLDNIFKSYLVQTHPEKELIIILNNDQFNLEAVKQKANNYPRVTVFQLPEQVSLGECLNLGFSNAAGTYLSKIDCDNYYGPHFISDLLLPFNYTAADIVGKLSNFYYIESFNALVWRTPEKIHCYVDILAGSGFIMKKHVFNKIKFNSINLGEDSAFFEECKKIGFKLYAADPYSYIIMRNIDKSQHTWKVDDILLIKECKHVSNGLDFDLVNT